MRNLRLYHADAAHALGISEPELRTLRRIFPGELDQRQGRRTSRGRLPANYCHDAIVRWARSIWPRLSPAQELALREAARPMNELEGMTP